MRRLFILLLITTVLLCLVQNRDGYHDYPTTVISAEQSNDNYLEWLLRGRGYEGKRVAEPDYNLRESTRLNNTLEKNGYTASPATPLLQRIMLYLNSWYA